MHHVMVPRLAGWNVQGLLSLVAIFAESHVDCSRAWPERAHLVLSLRIGQDLRRHVVPRHNVDFDACTIGMLVMRSVTLPRKSDGGGGDLSASQTPIAAGIVASAATAPRIRLRWPRVRPKAARMASRSLIAIGQSVLPCTSSIAGSGVLSLRHGTIKKSSASAARPVWLHCFEPTSQTW